MHDDPPPLRASAGALAPAVNALLAKDPAARPSHIETRRMLEAVASGRSATATVAPRTEPTRPAVDPRDRDHVPETKRTGWGFVAALLALLVVVGVGLAWFASRDPSRETAGGTRAEKDSS